MGVGHLHRKYEQCPARITLSDGDSGPSPRRCEPYYRNSLMPVRVTHGHGVARLASPLITFARTVGVSSPVKDDVRRTRVVYEILLPHRG